MAAIYVQVRYMEVRSPVDKKWGYLDSSGGLTRRLVHAVRYPSIESAEAEVAHIRRNYSDVFEAKVFVR